MNQDLLKQMKDIHLPTDPSWWPPAPGWWLLLGSIIVLSCTGLIFRYWVRQRRQAGSRGQVDTQSWTQRQKQALQALDNLSQTLSRQPEKSREILCQLAKLMKRLALYHPASDIGVAGLTGQAWLQWLDNHHDKKGVFESGLGNYWIRACLTNPIQTQPHNDMELIHACRDWIQQQTVQDES